MIFLESWIFGVFNLHGRIPAHIVDLSSHFERIGQIHRSMKFQLFSSTSVLLLKCWTEDDTLDNHLVLERLALRLSHPGKKMIAFILRFSTFWYGVTTSIYLPWLWLIYVRVNLLKIIKENRDFGSTITSFICRNSIRSWHGAPYQCGTTSSPAGSPGSGAPAADVLAGCISWRSNWRCCCIRRYGTSYWKWARCRW